METIARQFPIPRFSAGAGCNHMEHVSTQLPYSLLVAGCAFVGYLVAGLSGANLPLSLGTAVVMLIVVTTALHFMRRDKTPAAA